MPTSYLPKRLLVWIDKTSTGRIGGKEPCETLHWTKGRSDWVDVDLPVVEVGILQEKESRSERRFLICSTRRFSFSLSFSCSCSLRPLWLQTATLNENIYADTIIAATELSGLPSPISTSVPRLILDN